MTPLRQRMLEDMQVRNLAPLTQRAYLEHVSTPRVTPHLGDYRSTIRCMAASVVTCCFTR